MRVGIIGLGEIGSYYAEKILDAGYPLTVYNRTVSKTEKFAARGAAVAQTPGEVVERSDIMILALLNSEVVENIVREDMAPYLRAGQLVIDTSTCRPGTEVLCESICEAHGAGYLDAPLTRRAPGHILMVGGKEKYVTQAKELFDCISYKYRHVGPIGKGQVLKAMNQAYLANMLANNAEIIEFAVRAQMDPALLSTLLEFPVPQNMLEGNYDGKRNLSMHYKDLGYFLEIAHDTMASVPLTGFVHEIFKATKLSGDPSWAQAGIRTYYQRLNAVRPEE